MAASKNGGAFESFITLLAVAFGGYMLMRFLTAPRSSAAVPGGFVGGTYTGAAMSPYGSAANAQQQNSLLNALLGSLLKPKAGGGSGFSMGSGGGSSPSFARVGSPGLLQQEAQAIGNYTTIANTMPLSELNGASLASYDPSYNMDTQLPLDTSGGLLYDVNQNSMPIDPSGGLSTTDYTGPDSIDLTSYQNMDLSSYDPSSF